MSPTASSANPLAVFANLMAEAFGGRQAAAAAPQGDHQPQQQQQSPAPDASESQISDQMFAQLVQVSVCRKIHVEIFLNYLKIVVETCSK